MGNSSQQVILAGGEDLISSGVEIRPGRAQLMFNYVCDVNGGYSKMKGYALYDGSDITLTFDTGAGTEPAAGDIVTIGDISATVIETTTSSGTWAGGDAAGTITVQYVYGGASAPSAGSATFDNAGASTCTVSAVASPSAVPGDGDIKGVWIWDDTIWAVRSDGATPTAHDVLYKATASGWQAASMGYGVAFSAGGGGSPSPVPKRGDTLTQGGVTAIVSGVAIVSGNFESAGTAAGQLYVHTIAGGSFAAGAATYGSGGDAITLSVAETAIALPSGTKYEFRNHNFSGTADGYLMYMISRAGSAIEYDGNAIVGISSGRSPNKPNHLEAHGDRLFLSFPGGDIFFSSPGNPTTGFTQDYTAGSVNVGDECTAMQSLPGGVLALFGEKNSKLLSGNLSGASGNMELKDHSKNIGAIEWTVQQMADTYFLSHTGATSLYQTNKFGDFAGAGLSQAVEPLVRAIKGVVVDSVALKSRGHWRIFYDEKSGDGTTQFVNCTFSAGRAIGWSRGEIGFTMTAVNTGYIGTDEYMIAGDDSGNVYRMEYGRNQDGSDMRTGVILPYNAYGNVMVDKQWRKMIFQLDTQEEFDFNYATEFNYSASGWASGAESTDKTKGGGAFWGLGEWGTFYWGGTATYGTTELDTFGVGFNMAVIFTATADNIPDHTLRAYSAIYEQRRYVH